jgi:anthranilate phosphoribosyltransferase
VEDVTTSSAEENMAAFFRILYGVERGPKTDLVAANAGAALYLMDEADSLQSGVARAQELLAEGAAVGKLRDFVRVVGSEERLTELEGKWLSA